MAKKTAKHQKRVPGTKGGKPPGGVERKKRAAAKTDTVSEAPTGAARTELRRAAAAKKAASVRTQRRAEFRKALKNQRVVRIEPTIAALGATPSLRILAEGDSWFDFPFGGRPFKSGDVIARLQERMDVPILNEAVRGDEVRQLLGVKQRRRIEELLADEELRFNVLLFSGGGNDIVGDAFCLWLNDRAAVDGDVDRAVNETAFSHALGIVRSGYEQLIAIRDAATRQSPPRSITLFLHAYDFARPSGKGVCGYGPWLKPSLGYRGWTDMGEGTAIVRIVLTRFRQMLEDLARQSTDVIVINTQQTLGPADWNDELHPNRTGFGKIAERFHEAIQNRFGS
ncbi:MAG: SGNH/GDSL hydrolase family protein [Phycisphaerales bacterium]|nr:SGNH/GDSL hydrolase family protein [Phycisphaerales bacterium]